MLGGGKKINGGHFIGQNVGIGANVYQLFFKNGVSHKHGNSTKSCGHKLSTKVGKRVWLKNFTFRREREKIA